MRLRATWKVRTLVISLLLTLLVGGAVTGCNRPGATVVALRPVLATLAELLAWPPAELGAVDVARRNLLCAQDLPAGRSLALAEAEAQLDTWAARVRSETQRHRYRFERNPAEFEGSEGYFKMLMLGVVLAEDYGVRYHPGRRAGPETANARDGFFADSTAVFLTGLLGKERQGTCSSLPVLYVAVGRRLGYPLKLVTTKGHLFMRWEAAGDRFNVEVAGQGLNRFPDDYYRHWPFEVTAAEEAAEGYLKSLTPAEELAVFLSVRAMCLREAGRLGEAGAAFAAAARLAPGVGSYRVMAARCREEADDGGQRIAVEQKRS
jgi:hypothetical protein